ncbi:NAD(P)-dependent oxidoreductase [Jiangella aurantiaca]|uniref:NAD(P)-dependent oxidoreductase n=1 Tax=Jiangella aurantiaca TaxID=2530373 RepID=A0A4R5AMG1_9ACTN|nr:NAD(P)-dependent oxidoreductase [Jiangella aurantiaca]
MITGAAGGVADQLRPRLRRPGRTLRLLDVRPPAEPAGASEELVIGSIIDVDELTAACRDIDAVIHLGGESREAPAEDVLRSNAYGTWCVLEAARRAGTSRVVIASSSHAVGFVRTAEAPVPADVPGRADTLYGWSKIAAEAAGRLYHDRYGMDVICLRIGTWRVRPTTPRELATWLSPDDGARLIEACLAATSPGYRVMWGISRNTRRWCSLAEGEAIGYVPRDDAERYAGELIARSGAPDITSDPQVARIGGTWCHLPLGVRHAATPHPVRDGCAPLEGSSDQHLRH